MIQDKPAETNNSSDAPLSSGNVSAMPGGIDQEVDLLEYLHALLQRKYRLTVIAFLGAVFMFGLTFLQSNIYLATSVLAINIDEKPGGVAPKEYRSSDTIGLLERDFVISGAAANERERIMARMRSAQFSEIFIQENNLLTYIYHKQWDPYKRKWEEDFVPDIREAIKSFNEDIREIEYDEKTGLLRVSFKTRDPEFSAVLANKFVQRFNDYSRGLSLDELGDRRRYLESRLREVQNLELHRSIFRLLETQLAAETLINARKSFPLEEIQPAVPPFLKFKPKRLLTAALSFIGLMFFGITFIIGKVLFGKIKSGLNQYTAINVVEALPNNNVSQSIQPVSRRRLFDRWRREKSNPAEADEWVDK